MNRYQKTILAATAAICVIGGCALTENPAPAVNLISTHPVDAEVLPVEKVQELVLRDIIESGYARPDGELMTNNPHLQYADWGPVIFVENLNEESLKYYYVFYAAMPDGALAAEMAFHAQTGKFLQAGTVPYNPTNNRKVFVTTPAEAIGYAAAQLDLEKDSLNAAAVFYLDWSTKTFNIANSWKYRVTRTDKSPIRAAGMDLGEVYVEPYIVAPGREAPSIANTPGMGKKSRLFALVENTEPNLPAGTKRFIMIE